MPASPRPARQRIAGPDATDPEYDLQPRRNRRRGPLTVAQQLERLVSKGRERRESTQQTDEQEGSRRWREQTPRFAQSRQNADRQAARNVDRQRLERKRPARFEPAHESAHSVTQH